MRSPYRAAVQQALPDARLVADRFHLVRLANEMVTEVRQRVFREQRQPPRTCRPIRRGRTAGCCSAPPTGSPTHRSSPVDRDLRRLLRPDLGDRRVPGCQGTPSELPPATTRPAQQLRGTAPLPRDRARPPICPRAARLAGDHRYLVAADPRLPRDPHTDAGTEGTNRMIKDAGTHRLRLPQPRLPTPPSTVPLHPAITPERQCRGVRSPSTLKNHVALEYCCCPVPE